MSARRRKKNSRQRGSTTYGWGARKKHRGSGNKGGKGMAGTGKRSDAKKTMIWKERYFGKYGFKKKGITVDIMAINLGDLEIMLEKWLSEKKIKKESDIFVIDLTALGYNKLLGTGTVNHKLKIDVVFASENSISKVKEAGGEVKTKGAA